MLNLLVVGAGPAEIMDLSIPALSWWSDIAEEIIRARYPKPAG